VAHILPSGRNFYAVEPRALPSQAAWRVGQQLAREAIERYRREENCYPEMVGLTAWGTSQMRTHGDDIAEAFALLGVEPVWSPQSRRLDGVAVIPLDKLGRPRVDVTLRISGFFRDAFPHLIQLFDDAVTLVVNLEEPLEQNFPRKHYLVDLAGKSDLPVEEAEAQARYRVFGTKPGAYGAGILPLIETGSSIRTTTFSSMGEWWPPSAHSPASSRRRTLVTVRGRNRPEFTICARRRFAFTGRAW
jgi:cobaltochelatase CobN